MPDAPVPESNRNEALRHIVDLTQLLNGISSTAAHLAAALRHIAELTQWLNSHPLTPQHAQQRADRVRELERWRTYLAPLDRAQRRQP
ncbi:MAG: hypothetical protein ABSH35_00740 [Isosphaeraceae bacterium]|jgi:hypothetical protein